MIDPRFLLHHETPFADRSSVADMDLYVLDHQRREHPGVALYQTDLYGMVSSSGALRAQRPDQPAILVYL